MANEFANPFSPGFFFPGTASDPTVSLPLRQKLALAMLMQKRAYPTTLGQGLSAIGDAIGDIGIQRRILADDKAAQEAIMTPAPPASPAAPSSQPRYSYAPEDKTDGGATRSVTPTSSLTSGPGDIPVYDPKDYNPLDQQSDLQDQRAGYVKQLQNDPQAMTKMAGLMSAEEGPGAANSDARTALAETIFNRGISRGIPNVNQVMSPRYYQPMMPNQTNKYSDHVAMLQNNPAYRAQVMSEIQRAGAGSNVSNLATDNASGGVAQRSMGDQTLTYQPGGSSGTEAFFRKDIRPDVHGAGVVPATAAWVNRLATAPPQQMVAQQQGAPQPGVMAFDGQPANAPTAVDAVNGFAGQPPTPQIRQAPQPQIAQAPQPGYVPQPMKIPTAPDAIQPSPREQELTGIFNRQMMIDPERAPRGPVAQELQQLQANRKYQQDRQTEDFKAQEAAARAHNLKVEEMRGSAATREAEALTKAEEAKQAQRFGSVEQAKAVRTEMVKSRESALASKEVLDTVSQVRDGIDNAIVGYGADRRLDWNKALKLFNLKDTGDTVKNTELLRARISTMVGPLRRAMMSGTTSDADMKILLQAAGGDLNMEPESLKAVVDAMGRTARNSVEQHNKDTEIYYSANEAPKDNKYFKIDLPPKASALIPTGPTTFNSMEEAQAAANANPSMIGKTIVINGKKFKVQ